MKKMLGICGVVCACVALTACVGPKKYTMNYIPADSNGDRVESREALLEEGHFMGNSASRQEASLAEMIVATNNGAVQEFAKLEKMEAQDLKVSEETLALAKEGREIASKNLQNTTASLEILREWEAKAKLQGTGEITLFFATDASSISSGSENHRRLVQFLDYLATKSYGRKVKFLLVGSASATGSAQHNLRLSEKRAKAPVETIGTYLVNVPHEILRVHGVGDAMSPKDAKGAKKYQNVRVIAVYDESQAPQGSGN